MNWREKLRTRDRTAQFDIEEEFKKSLHPRPGESAIIGKPPIKGDGVSPSVICRANGSIEIFASSKMGIRIDPLTETISIIAPNISLRGNVIDMNTDPFLGLRWNKKPLNLTTELVGMSPVGPVTVVPGTLLPYDTTVQDYAKLAKNLLKGLVI